MKKITIALFMVFAFTACNNETPATEAETCTDSTESVAADTLGAAPTETVSTEAVAVEVTPAK